MLLVWKNCTPWLQTVIELFSCLSWKDKKKHSFDFNKCSLKYEVNIFYKLFCILTSFEFEAFFLESLFVFCGSLNSYNPGENLLRQIAKMPIFFSYHPGKNWNLRQMNAWFPTSPYPKLFTIAWQLYTLVFRPRQLWIGGGEGAYFFSLEETGVGRKS